MTWDIMDYLSANLEVLDATCAMTASDIGTLAQLTRLSSLQLHIASDHRLAQADLDALGCSLTHLRALKIHAGCYDDEGCYVCLPSEVSSLSALQRAPVTLLQLQPTEAMLASTWVQLTRIRRLELHVRSQEPWKEPDFLRIPANMQILCNLRHLSLRALRLSGSLATLGSLSQLTALRLYKVTALHDPEGGTALPELLSCLTSLRMLDVFRCTPLRIEACALHRLSALTKLRLVGQRICNDDFAYDTDEPQGHIASFPPNIIELNLSTNELVCLPEGIAQLSKLTLLDLRRQDYRDCSNRRHLFCLDDSLVDIVSMPQLRRVLLGQLRWHNFDEYSMKRHGAAQEAISVAQNRCTVDIQAISRSDLWPHVSSTDNA